ncbi:hypothetical protein LLEC1_04574, partial [Akanthomyces lecanii]
MSNSTEVNQQYFNKIAADYDRRFASFLGEISDELHSHIDFIGVKKGGRLLDYACGTGSVSNCFSDVIGQAVGVDITENMIGAYNVKAANAVRLLLPWLPTPKLHRPLFKLLLTQRLVGFQNVPEDQRKAYLGNLLSTPPSPSLDGPLFHGFDVAGVGFGFHHFEDTTLA